MHRPGSPTVLILCAALAALLPAAAAGRPSSARQSALASKMRHVLAVQVRLDRAGFSPGEIDARPGANTTGALKAFQRAEGLKADGTLSAETLAALDRDTKDVLTSYVLTEGDLAGPFAAEIPDDLMLQAELPALAYRSPLEMLGERFHSSPDLLRRLNPGATFVTAGEELRVPAVVQPASTPDVVRTSGQGERTEVVIVVSKAERSLAVESGGRVVLHAPVTVGSEHDPLPIGEWAVTGLHPNPVFHYNPDLFWDADPSHAKAKIQPGPNNPVGVMWIDLTREHYGLHGTPEPGRVGHTASHGCVRLTNWDIERVGAYVRKGTRVVFKD
jgi:lipoprotein-anchoring transpeptidase ErfK/SrfK